MTNKDLLVRAKSFELTKEIYLLTRPFPSELDTQIRLSQEPDFCKPIQADAVLARSVEPQKILKGLRAKLAR